MAADLLAGRVALITGAGQGLGRAIAREYSDEGATVALLDLNPTTLEETRRLIEESGGTAHEYALDITDHEAYREAVSDVVEQAGSLDVLVNNAAIARYGTILDDSLEDWRAQIAVNLEAVYMGSKLVAPHMVERGSGSIVNISSGAAIGPGRGPYEDQTARGGTMYGASKAALERMTQGLAQEVSAHNITVAALSPSQVVPTPGTVFHKLVDGLEDPKGEPPEYMARATLLLATEGAEKVTGRVTYSQAILQEFGWIEDGKGTGIDRPGSGYSQA